MELTIALVLSILGSVISVCSFVLSRKDKSNKDIGTEQYEKGVLNEKLKNIMEKLEQIETKLDNMNNETKNIVAEEMEKHILKYHMK